ncbi:hypothetical protein A2U01_0017206 [Trifolium medium]|uniref:Uncharacterized protein n=1 Tax=Trifolium medium TaxID=97028 RepID=A0A392N9D8_9FABA|nr:hypothetical protein [Trifolium medium]
MVKLLRKKCEALVAEEIRPEVLNASFLTKMHITSEKLVHPKKSFAINNKDPMKWCLLHLLVIFTVQEPEERKGKQKRKLKKKKMLKKKAKVEKDAEKMSKQKYENPAKKGSEVQKHTPAKKRKHAASSEDSSETDTDDQTIAARIRRGKAAHVAKSMSSKNTSKADCEKGYTVPINTIYPEQNEPTIEVSTSDTNTEELDRTTDEVINEGTSFIAKKSCAETSQKLDDQTPSDTPLKELINHLSKDTLNSHPFTHEIAKSISQPNFSPQNQPHISTLSHLQPNHHLNLNNMMKPKPNQNKLLTILTKWTLTNLNLLY